MRQATLIRKTAAPNLKDALTKFPDTRRPHVSIARNGL
jgi:hypothetical protein